MVKKLAAGYEEKNIENKSFAGFEQLSKNLDALKKGDISPSNDSKDPSPETVLGKMAHAAQAIGKYTAQGIGLVTQFGIEQLAQKHEGNRFGEGVVKGAEFLGKAYGLKVGECLLESARNGQNSCTTDRSLDAPIDYALWTQTMKALGYTE